SENVRALALAPAVLSLLESLYDCKPLPFQTLNFRVGTQQRAHSDTIHFNSIPSGYLCGVWVALEDIDLDNGPLIYYPGSHRLPELTVEHVNKAMPPEFDTCTQSDLYARYERLISSRIARFGFESRYGVLKRGQALLWSANLQHGGAIQRDKSRTRHSQVTHYFFEGCRYYTPIACEGDRMAWREPFWISDEVPEVVAPEKPVVPLAPPYLGYHDDANSSVIIGWAGDSSRPNEPISVDIYGQGELLDTVVADEFRADVALNTGDDGRHGFRIPTDRILNGRGRRVVTVTIAGTDMGLHGTPRSFVFPS